MWVRHPHMNPKTVPRISRSTSERLYARVYGRHPNFGPHHTFPPRPLIIAYCFPHPNVWPTRILLVHYICANWGGDDASWLFSVYCVNIFFKTIRMLPTMLVLSKVARSSFKKLAARNYAQFVRFLWWNQPTQCVCVYLRAVFLMHQEEFFFVRIHSSSSLSRCLRWMFV